MRLIRDGERGWRGGGLEGGGFGSFLFNVLIILFTRSSGKRSCRHFFFFFFFKSSCDVFQALIISICLLRFEGRSEVCGSRNALATPLVNGGTFSPAGFFKLFIY